MVFYFRLEVRIDAHSYGLYYLQPLIYNREHIYIYIYIIYRSVPTTNCAVEKDSIRTTITHKSVKKTTNMAHMRHRRIGRERDLSDK